MLVRLSIHSPFSTFYQHKFFCLQLYRISPQTRYTRVLDERHQKFAYLVIPMKNSSNLWFHFKFSSSLAVRPLLFAALSVQNINLFSFFIIIFSILLFLLTLTSPVYEARWVHLSKVAAIPSVYIWESMEGLIIISMLMNIFIGHILFFIKNSIKT